MDEPSKRSEALPPQVDLVAGPTQRKRTGHKRVPRAGARVAGHPARPEVPFFTGSCSTGCLSVKVCRGCYTDCLSPLWLLGFERFFGASDSIGVALTEGEGLRLRSLFFAIQTSIAEPRALGWTAYVSPRRGAGVQIFFSHNKVRPSRPANAALGLSLTRWQLLRLAEDRRPRQTHHPPRQRRVRPRNTAAVGLGRSAARAASP